MKNPSMRIDFALQNIGDYRKRIWCAFTEFPQITTYIGKASGNNLNPFVIEKIYG